MKGIIQTKICGLTRRKDVEFAIEVGVNALGFILAPSPRKVDLSQAAILCRDLPPFIHTVAVVVNPTREDLKRIYECGLFHWVQFCGKEPAEVLKNYPGRTIRALGIEGTRSAISIQKLNESMQAIQNKRDLLGGGDLLLLDSRSQEKVGGTGRPFNWDLLTCVDLPRPFLLAGGLNPYNLLEALGKMRPDGVDLNSGIEDEPGIKNPLLIRRCLEIIREYESIQREKERTQ